MEKTMWIGAQKLGDFHGSIISAVHLQTQKVSI